MSSYFNTLRLQTTFVAMRRHVRHVHVASCVALAGMLTVQVAGAQAQAVPEASVVAAATPQRSSPSARTLDEAYTSALHDALQAKLHYPTSREARLLQPRGTVTLWIDLDRSGQLIDAKLVSGSGQRMLDMEALRSVRNSRFPAFPAGSFADKSSQRFVMSMAYVMDER